MRTRRQAVRREIDSVTSEARSSLNLAETALASGEALLGKRFLDAPDDFAAAHLLFREGLAWAAGSISCWQESGVARGVPSFEAAWGTLRTDSASQIAKLSEEDAALLKQAFVLRTAFEARTLRAPQLARETTAMRHELKRVTSELRRRLARYRAVRRAQALRWAAAAALTVGVVLALVAHQMLKEPVDLALNKPVTVSSTWGKYKTADKVVDGVTTGIGFHTRFETRPWLLIDLGDVVTVHEFEIYNRDDCCLKRTAPLVIATSTDGKEYRQVARREDAFAVWNVKIAPVQARFVKLYIDRQSHFHLAEVIVR